MIDMSLMTWMCDICGRLRNVAHRPLRGLEDGFPDTRFNLKFCNDTADCIAKAHDTEPWPPLQETP